jgi:hypothetical protein
MNKISKQSAWKEKTLLKNTPNQILFQFILKEREFLNIQFLPTKQWELFSSK